MSDPTRHGILFVVGCGHSLAGQITIEALNCIKKAEKVIYNLSGLSEEWILRLNPGAESLTDLYQPGKDRAITYAQMVDRIMEPVRANRKVCAVFYGHPGVFVQASHEAI